MKVLNSRTKRKTTILSLPPEEFESYFDYYVYIHLNRDVVILHCIGMILGFIFLALAIWKMSWIFLALHLISFNLIPLVSHWIFDGIMTPTASGAPLVSIWYAIRINMWYLTGQQYKKEHLFFEKYPFARKYYSEN